LNYPLPDQFAVLACFGAEIADETSVSPTIALKIIDLRIDEGAQALRRWNRLVAKSLMDHRACAFEIEIKDFEAKSFFRNEVIGKRSLRDLRRFNYVADARASEPALVHDAKARRQYFLPVRRLTHKRNMYVRITNVKKPVDQAAAPDALVGVHALDPSDR
jgi:hypothetical protein